MKLWYVLVLTVMASLAVKQISHILMFGSIFGAMRKAIRERAEAKQLLFVKLHELLSCRLCTTTQTALWTVGLPSLLMGLAGPYNDFLVLWVSGMASFAVGALALGLWTFLEYPSSRYHSLEEAFERFQNDRHESLNVMAQRLGGEKFERMRYKNPDSLEN